MKYRQNKKDSDSQETSDIGEFSVLGECISFMTSHVEKSDFGTNLAGKDSVQSQDVKSAILSIFLGARIHDAAVLVGISDRTMRDRFLTYCKQTNPERFESIYECAAHRGYSTPPVELFQRHVMEFFNEEDLPILHQQSSPSLVKELAEKNVENAKVQLSLARIRLSVVDGMSRILGSE
ncbi:hypothetical protein [Vibrio nigripulchritudo]|nr:hypothetical protein [Vibrio nigripulchritudo]